jgi:transposase
MTPSIALGLQELDVSIVCIDARQVHQSLKAMRANKTDPHDAAGLAQLARTGFYKEVHVKSPAAHGVRSVITARGHLVEAHVRLDNTIRGLCATFGIRLGIGQGTRFLTRMREAATNHGSARRWRRCSACASAWPSRSPNSTGSSR